VMALNVWLTVKQRDAKALDSVPAAA